MSAIGGACLARREDFAPVSAAKLLWQLERMGYVEEAFYMGFAPVVSGHSMQACTREDRQHMQALGVSLTEYVTVFSYATMYLYMYFHVFQYVSISCNDVLLCVLPCITTYIVFACQWHPSLSPWPSLGADH